MSIEKMPRTICFKKSISIYRNVSEPIFKLMDFPELQIFTSNFHQLFICQRILSGCDLRKYNRLLLNNSWLIWNILSISLKESIRELVWNIVLVKGSKVHLLILSIKTQIVLALLECKRLNFTFNAFYYLKI